MRGFALLILAAGVGFGSAAAQLAIQPTVDITKVPAAAQPSAQFNADAATEAYMAMIPPAARARSNAYFEGGYWLILWDFLYSSAICLVLLQLRWSARMRDLAERVSRYRPVQTFLYWLQYVLLTALLGFPLEFYENFVREHKYGLATQSFGPWMGDEGKALLINMVLGGIAAVVLFAIVRKLRNTWWIWGSIAAFILAVFAVAIGPVFLQPIFNKVTRLDDPRVTAPILRMAHANGIPTNDVYEIDASRQSTRISANVSGFANTMRITLNDNLLRRGSPEEIQAVMGHEMGHYVLNHIPKLLFFLGGGDRDLVCLSQLGAGLGARALGRALGDSRGERPGGAAAGSADGRGVVLCAHAGDEHDDAHSGERSGHVRSQCRAPAGWFRPGRDSPFGLSQDASWSPGRMDLLRPSQRL